MRPPVSAIMPNFNHARFLTEALPSVISQLRPDDELIVIDDASSDNSIEIIQRAINGLPNARLIVHEVNHGALATLNEGLALAKNKYVCFPGADDIVVPGAFEAALSLLARHPDAGFCSGLIHVIDEAGRPVGPLPTRIVLDAPGFLDQDRCAAELMRDDTWIGGLAFYRTDLLRKAGGFLPELRNFTDGFACRLIAARNGCCFVPQPFQLWRRMSAGLSSREMLNFANVDEIGNRTVRLMETTYRTDFPPGYAARWLGRWLFGAQHFALQNRQYNRWRTLRAAAQRGGPAATRLTALMLAILRLPAVAILFLRYRPHDAAAVVQRRLLRRHSALRSIQQPNPY